MDAVLQLRAIVDEAVLLQGFAEDLIEGVKARRSLAELAPPGGVLISRFVALRAQVPDGPEARMVRETLDHHAMLLHCALDLLGDLYPERVADQIDELDGLGPPARRLCALQERLRVAAGPAGEAPRLTVRDDTYRVHDA
jgi:hypothetical protein